MERPSNLIFQIANNKGADQTARMRRLVCAFVVRKHQIRGFFRMEAHNDAEAPASWPPLVYVPDIHNVDILNICIKELGAKIIF